MGIGVLEWWSNEFENQHSTTPSLHHSMAFAGIAVTRVLPWLIFVCFAFGSIYEAAKLPFGNVSAPGAGFFPVVLAALLAVISISGFIAAFREAAGHENLETGLVWNKIILTVAALLGFGVLFEHAGYLVTTFLFVVFQLRMVERKGWALAGAVALSASLVSYILFGLVLGAPLPAGFLRI